MQIEVKQGRVELAEDEAVLLNCFEEVKRLVGVLETIDDKLSGAVSHLFETGDFTAKSGQTAILYPQGRLKFRRIILVGLGKRNEIAIEKIRRAYGFAGRKLRELKLKSVSVQAFESSYPAVKLQEASQAMVEGMLLSNYRLDCYKTVDENERVALQRLTFLKEKRKGIGEIKRGKEFGEIFSWATNFSRDLANRPGNYLTPERLAGEADRLARENNLKCRIFSAAEIKKLKMNTFLAVASGSKQPSKLIVLEYVPPQRSTNTLALVGKGITFDAGGLSLKTTEGMVEMKGDMMGGAVVIATIAACAKMGLPLHLIGIVPATENLPSGSALKVGDILTSHLGKTIEVLNTDAEGRLILADALSYARSFKPDAILDVATLTGTIKLALGTICAGLFGNHRGLKAQMLKAGEMSGERIWEMPLWKEYDEFLKSDLADIKNVGGRFGGAILAAAFLQNFVGDLPWIHLDIAGVDFKEKDDSYHSKGATGFGARLLLQFLKDWKKI
ncbi:MAG: leucyl aminopeptidase [candidate division Zixibacteria bacterium]|nr:leucyl aminopeptidase [candidate division Zixibacteria bacterium]